MNRLDVSIDKIFKDGTNGNKEIEAGLREIYNSTPLGHINDNLVSTVWGINHRQVPLSLPFNRDSYGLTFFTKPRLNLNTRNLRHVRQMYPLLNDNPRSIQRIIRCTLDPNLQNHDEPAYKETEIRQEKYECPFVDENNIFIPLLSNLCLTISGWPDFVVDTKTTPEGHFREAHSMIDSAVEIKNVYELSASFRNIPHNPITLLFYFWILYAAKVFEGELIPYPSSIWSNEIDYNTRIYRLILDPSKRYVQHIISTGAAFPLNSPVGALGNFDNSQPYNDANDNINIRFQCMGMEYNDPYQIKDFNDAVCLFNENMKDDKIRRNMIQIPYSVLLFFNMHGYPRINTKTMELEWWISPDLYKKHQIDLVGFLDTVGLDRKPFTSEIVPNDSKHSDGIIERIAEEYLSDEDREIMNRGLSVYRQQL